MNYIQQVFKGKNDWFLYVISIILIAIGWQIIGFLPLLAVAVMHTKNMAEFERAANTMFMDIGIAKNLFLFLMVLSFAIGLLVLFLCVKYIHKRTVTSLITARKQTDWKRIFFAFFLWLAVGVFFIFLGIALEPEAYQWNFKPLPFFTLLAVSFLWLPLQTSFEELLFRGYLMQGFGALFKNALAPLIITSVIFGLLHGANPEMAKLGPMLMIFYIGTGLTLGIMTLMDDGTELALGFHAANNIVAAILVTNSWTVFQTDALYIENAEPTLGFSMFVPVFVMYPLLLLVFSKKYGWTNWKEKLTGRIEKPLIEEDFIVGEDL